MTAYFRFNVNREDRIFGFAEALLNLYRLILSVRNYIRKVADHFLAVLATLFALALTVVVIPALLVLLIFLSIGLVYSILFFVYQEKRQYKSLAKFERKELVALHVKMRHTVKKMEALKSSEFLFKIPIVGFLMRMYLRHISRAEKAVKQRAYPNYNIPPKNPRIHDYDPSDPWQQDMSDLKRLKDLPAN